VDVVDDQRTWEYKGRVWTTACKTVSLVSIPQVNLIEALIELEKTKNILEDKEEFSFEGFLPLICFGSFIVTH
jgi:hypothetical protein